MHRSLLPNKSPIIANAFEIYRTSRALIKNRLESSRSVTAIAWPFAIIIPRYAADCTNFKGTRDTLDQARAVIVTETFSIDPPAAPILRRKRSRKSKRGRGDSLPRETRLAMPIGPVFLSSLRLRVPPTLPCSQIHEHWYTCDMRALHVNRRERFTRNKPQQRHRCVLRASA